MLRHTIKCAATRFLSRRRKENKTNMLTFFSSSSFVSVVCWVVLASSSSSSLRRFFVYVFGGIFRCAQERNRQHFDFCVFFHSFSIVFPFCARYSHHYTISPCYLSVSNGIQVQKIIICFSLTKIEQINANANDVFVKYVFGWNERN